MRGLLFTGTSGVLAVAVASSSSGAAVGRTEGLLATNFGDVGSKGAAGMLALARGGGNGGGLGTKAQGSGVLDSALLFAAWALLLGQDPDQRACTPAWLGQAGVCCFFVGLATTYSWDCNPTDGLPNWPDVGCPSCNLMSPVTSSY